MRKSSTNSSSDRINGVSVSSKSSKSFSSSISSGGKKEPAGCEDKVCFKFLDENVQSILIFYSFDGFKSKIAVDHGNISEARAESWTSPKEATSVRSFQTIFTIHEDLMWGNSENKLRLCGSSPQNATRLECVITDMNCLLGRPLTHLKVRVEVGPQMHR